ncbi:phospholipase D-like domain-containing protein [Aurantivibrio infirmus]
MFFKYLLAISLLKISIFAAANDTIATYLEKSCDRCASLSGEKTGLYVLEKGEEALLARSWLADHAQTSIDVQYFIWSSDNIGTLAAEALLEAAERGVRVRVIVDDLLVDASESELIGLNLHPNVSIKIYNPLHSVGVSTTERAWNLAARFKDSNQRMHDKTAIFDGIAGITGGRNMADEYFDYDQEYNFRDRDILLVGRSVKEMQNNFDEFWESDLSKNIEDVLSRYESKKSNIDVTSYYKLLHDYADDPENFEPEIREYFKNISEVVPQVLADLVWADAIFISDAPGKNDSGFGLSGGGDSTDALVEVLSNAKQSILIQSPYLIMPSGGIDFFAELIQRGVDVKISTNSLASTDNLPAFSGYSKQRKAMLKAGIEIYEFNPEPAHRTEMIARFERIEKNQPIFALHAKSFVVDGETLYVGTFNLDPRSANLNTEVGVLVSNKRLAQQVEQSILLDIESNNSWQTFLGNNPDKHASLGKRLRVMWLKMLPLTSIL